MPRENILLEWDLGVPEEEVSIEEAPELTPDGETPPAVEA